MSTRHSDERLAPSDLAEDKQLQERPAEGSRRPAPEVPSAPERLRRSHDFAATMRGGRRARHALLTMVARRTDQRPTRVGFAVSRWVGGAVVRNRVKRQLRMAMRAFPWRPGFDVVVIPQLACASARFEELNAALKSSAAKLLLLMVVTA